MAKETTYKRQHLQNYSNSFAGFTSHALVCTSANFFILMSLMVYWLNLLNHVMENIGGLQIFEYFVVCVSQFENSNRQLVQ